ncbi:hypothetical protein AAG570_002753 [Ranatra chinensis]|uniref:Uncharacterized protein n=1 Tax=Ranatra chinensis TaxID=642074 RepID=A0ABD0YJ56_9HEMI
MWSTVGVVLSELIPTTPGALGDVAPSAGLLTTEFTPQRVLQICPDIGLIVDLTNTTRYYDKQDFTRKGVEYEKVTCPGHVVPPWTAVMSAAGESYPTLAGPQVMLTTYHRNCTAWLECTASAASLDRLLPLVIE